MKSRRGESKGVRSDARRGRKWRAVMSINIFLRNNNVRKKGSFGGKKVRFGREL